MSKTVKTIAWICLVLGLLGLAVDIGLYVRGREVVTKIAEQVEAGELPALGRRFDDTESGEVIKPDESFRGKERPFGGSFPAGMRGGGFMPQWGPGRQDFRWLGFGAPILLLAAGPILLVVGAVTLIVNREPKKKETEAKKSMNKEKTHKN